MKEYVNVKKNVKEKGDGTGDGQCKKVTIAIFSSGSVIITVVIMSNKS